MLGQVHPILVVSPQYFSVGENYCFTESPCGTEGRAFPRSFDLGLLKRNCFTVVPRHDLPESLSTEETPSKRGAVWTPCSRRMSPPLEPTRFHSESSSKRRAGAGSGGCMMRWPKCSRKPPRPACRQKPPKRCFWLP